VRDEGLIPGNKCFANTTSRATNEKVIADTLKHNNKAHDKSNHENNNNTNHNMDRNNTQD